MQKAFHCKLLHTVQFFAKSCDISCMQLKSHTVAQECGGLEEHHQALCETVKPK